MKTYLKKTFITFITLFFSFLFTTSAYAVEYLSIEKKPTTLCTDIVFKNQLAGENIKLISLTVLKDQKTRIAKIDYPNIVPATSEPYNRWSVWISKYLVLKSPTVSQSATFAKSVMSAKKFVETNISCAKFSGVNLAYKLHTDTDTYDLAGYNNKSGLKEFNESYVPVETPTVAMIDSVLNKRNLLPDHEARIVESRSMVPGFPAIADLPDGAKHGNMMTFAGYTVNPKLVIPVYLAITASQNVTNSYVPIALDYMNTKLSKFKSENPRNRPVLNLSFGSPLGFTPEINREIQKIIDKGVPVVVSAGNNETYVESGVERNPSTITVGYSSDTEVLSAYGPGSLDFTVHTSSEVVPTYSDENGNIQYQSDAFTKSSTASMVVASALATMGSICPEATPKNLKAVLVLTAKPLPVSPILAINKKNSYLQYGVIDFKEAMILLMSTTCAHRLETPKETLRESLSYASTLPVATVEPTSPAYQFITQVQVQESSRVDVFKKMCADYSSQGYELFHQVVDNPRAIPPHVEGFRCILRSETGTIADVKWLNLAYFRPNPKLIFKKYVYIKP